MGGKRSAATALFPEEQGHQTGLLPFGHVREADPQDVALAGIVGG